VTSWRVFPWLKTLAALCLKSRSAMRRMKKHVSSHRRDKIDYQGHRNCSCACDSCSCYIPRFVTRHHSSTVKMIKVPRCLKHLLRTEGLVSTCFNGGTMWWIFRSSKSCHTLTTFHHQGSSWRRVMMTRSVQCGIEKDGNVCNARIIGIAIV